jgi:integrase
MHSSISSAHAAYLLQQASGCRVSELQMIRWHHVSDSGLIHIPASKGSNSRVVSCSSLIPYILISRRRPQDSFIPLTYRQIYCYYRRLGVSHKPHSTSKRCAVTHHFRHQLAHDIMSITDSDISQVTATLGHKCAKSSTYYVEDNKDGSYVKRHLRRSPQQGR